MLGNRLIKSNDAGGACTNTVDLYNPFPDGGGVALYQLNGDATDVSGNYDGTATNVTYGAGQFGQAGVFNGSSSWIDIRPIQDALNLNPYSFSVWINPTDLIGNEMIIFTQTAKSNFGLQLVDSVLYFYQYNAAVSQIIITYTGIQANTWTNIVGLWDGSNIKLYVDGSLVGSTPCTSIRSYESNTFSIGRYLASSTIHFNGSIDQVRIFSRALRQYEVEALYTEEYCTPTIVPSEHFNTVLYTGNGTGQSISSLDFAPDLVWIKNRNSTQSNRLYDSVRGANLQLSSNQTAAEGNSGGLTSFDSNGFSLDSWASVNTNNYTYVAWNFKAGGAAVTNTDGTITSQVSANTEAGFSVVTWTGNGVSGQSIGHGLNEVPSMIIHRRKLEASPWEVYHSSLGKDLKIQLNLTNASSSSSAWANTTPTSSVYYAGAYPSEMISYCFAEVEGFSNFGSYIGNGSTSGPTVITGFEPAFLLVKQSSASGEYWNIWDNKRSPENPRSNVLFPNLSNAELSNQSWSDVQFLENGFQVTPTVMTPTNQSGATYIYMAFAADPTAVEPSLEDSFNTVLYTGNGGTQNIGGVFEGGGSFNGSSSQIKLQDNLSIATGSNDFTLSTWIFLDSFTSPFTGIITTQANWYFYILISPTGEVLTYNQSIQVNSAAGVITTGKWYNIVATVSSTSGKNVYVNGSNVATSSDTSDCGDRSTSGGDNALGYYKSGTTAGSYYLDGSIDQVRIFNTALTAAQVTELYEETDADSSVCNFPSGAGGIALYELNGNANDTCGTYNGTATNVTWLNNGVGFQPDLVWIKARATAYNHRLFDSVRTLNGRLESNTTAAEVSTTVNDNFVSFNSNGFTLGATSETNGSNFNGEPYVAWAWKGAEIPAINSNGSIPSVVSANPAAGFSIVSYNSNGTAGSTIGHGLASSPDMIIIKNRDDVDKWAVYHSAVGGTKFLVLNETAVAVSSSAYWNNTNPNLNTFTVGSTSPVNSPNNEDYIAYCFAEVAGFSKFGSYSGSSGDVYVNTGFEPAFVVVKSITGTYSWYMIDNKRGSTSPTSNSLFANLSNAEAGGYGIYFDSTGFTVSSGVGTGTNSSGQTYIYMAFANQF